MYRAQIYSEIFKNNSNEKNKVVEAQNPLEESLKSYFKALQLDTKGNYKMEIVGGLAQAAAQLQNQAITQYNNNEFEKAMQSFAGSFEINNKVFQKVDTLTLYNAAISAEKANNLSMAKNFYKQLIGYKHQGSKMYHYLIDVNRREKNDTELQQTIADARKAYPNDKDILIDELNYYIENGKIKEALNNLNIAVEKDPTNSVLYFNLGTLYDNLANPKNVSEVKEEERKEMMQKAESNYKKAIELNPKYFDALFNLGAFYFNEGVKMNDKANEIKDNKKFEQEMVKVDAKFQDAVIPFEKAKEVGTDDKGSYKALLNSLKQVYARTGQNDKRKAIEDELKK